jgi:predicted house-cleaning NTP pyrophosphatase (Maf/HAM1 superfamily)
MLLNDLELVPDIGHSNGRDEQLQAAGKSTGELVVDLSWLKAMAGQKRPPIQPVNRC